MKTYLPGKILNFFSILVIFISFFSKVNAQNVAVTDDDTYIANSSAMLDVKSDSKGLLIPRLTTIQRGAINPVATGLLVFDTNYNSFFYYNGEEWLALPQVSTSTSAGDALFAVKNSIGDTIFAVYNDGVKVVVPYGTKGKVGGFAVSGRSPTKAGEEEYLLVTPDSTRVFVNEADVKGKVGGFAVSGRSPTKSVIKDYFVSTNDSTRIYVEESTKGSVGGFAVSGRSPGKTDAVKFMDLTPDNYFIGHNSGTNTTGKYNSFVGYEAGKSNVSGQYNLFFGYHAGYSNYSGVENIIIGYRAGISNYGGGYNTIIGNAAGENNTSGTYNVFMGVGTGGFNTSTSFLTMVGVNAGHFTLTGQGNAFFGCNAGWIHENGGNNTYIGTDAGRGGNAAGDYNPSSPSSTENTFIGTSSGYHIEGGDRNVFLGYSAGSSITTGSGNVFLGYMAGSSETATNSNKLYIENTSAGSSTALIYGDFNTNVLQLNANVGIGKVAAYKLDVAGDVNVTGNFKINGANIVTTTIVEGDLTATSPISLSAARKVIGGATAISIADATTSTKGAVQLSDSYGGTSQTLATTEKALTDGLATKVTGNGFLMEKIFMNSDGPIITTSLGFELYWDTGNDRILIINNGKKASTICHYWYQTQYEGNIEGYSGTIEPSATPADIGHVTGKGLEIHFGDNTGLSYCSVWIQCIYDIVTEKSYIIGHYTMY